MRAEEGGLGVRGGASATAGVRAVFKVRQDYYGRD